MCLWGFFQKRSIRISRLSKEHPHQCWLGIFQSVEGLNRTKRWKKGKSALCWSWNIKLLLPLDIGSLVSSVFGLWLELTPSAPWFSVLWTWAGLYHGLSWFFSLQIGRSWEFSASVIAWANPYYLSIYLSLHRSVLFLWRTLTSRESVICPWSVEPRLLLCCLSQWGLIPNREVLGGP